MQTLSAEHLEHVAEMSEDDKYFKTGILKPFLRTRVSDTEGNKAVREVCHFYTYLCCINLFRLSVIQNYRMAFKIFNVVLAPDAIEMIECS